MRAKRDDGQAAGKQHGMDISREMSRSLQTSMHSVELGHDAFDLMAVAAGRGYLDKATLIIPLEVSTVNWTLNFQHCFVRANTATNLP